MWEPDPAWTPLPTGRGTSTRGLWLATDHGRRVVVKRLDAPATHEPGALSQPRHFAYWRRDADVGSSHLLTDTPGVRAAAHVSITEDEEGLTLVSELVPREPTDGCFAARALGGFAGATLDDPGWLARDQLRDRLLRVERHGGWPTLERTTAADLADHLWGRRVGLLDRLDDLPQVPQHGDPTPANLPGRDGERLVGVDWGTLGTGPVGGDLGYFALSAAEDFDVLLEAYLDGLPTGLAGRDEVALGARITLAYTALSRAEWALARVAGGEGALAGKYHHPAVAPYLRSLQRHVGQLEALIG